METRRDQGGGAPATRPVVDRRSAAHARFVAEARAARLNPDDRWVDFYADYEWDHLRLTLQGYGVDPEGKDVLEFGCNVGGSAVVLAALGARVTGVEADPTMPAVAAANMARHGFAGDFTHVADSRALPFDTASFDLILANSVLEYVDPGQLDGVIAEFRRLLRPGGLVFICGTASRLAPRELHSRAWLVNYLPRWIDRLSGRSPQRGLSPWALARALRGGFEGIDDGGWERARLAIHGRVPPLGRLLARASRTLGGGPGWVTPYIEGLFRRI